MKRLVPGHGIGLLQNFKVAPVMVRRTGCGTYCTLREKARELEWSGTMELEANRGVSMALARHTSAAHRMIGFIDGISVSIARSEGEKTG